MKESSEAGYISLPTGLRLLHTLRHQGIDTEMITVDGVVEVDQAHDVTYFAFGPKTEIRGK